MKVYSTKEMIHGLQISHPTLRSWVESGMPVIRQDPLLFDSKVVQWIKENKPEKYDFLIKYIEMLGC